MKEKLLKNLRAKGLETNTQYNNLSITYPVTDELTWTEKFNIDKTTEKNIEQNLNGFLTIFLKKFSQKSIPLTTPNYHKLLLTNTSNLFTVTIDYAKMDNITIDIANSYLQCVINDFVIYRCNDQGKEGMIVNKSIIQPKKPLKKNLENLLEEFNQLA